jgi:hypothetical protein
MGGESLTRDCNMHILRDVNSRPVRESDCGASGNGDVLDWSRGRESSSRKSREDEEDGEWLHV